MKKNLLAFLAVLTFTTGIFAMGGGFYYAGNETDPAKMFGGGKRTGKLLKYGRWEARTKIMGGPSVVSCFILINYKAPNAWANPPQIDYWHEVDIEINGKNRNTVETVVHEGELAYMNPDRTYLYNHHPYEFDVDADYHTWAIEWTPNRVVLELDGVPYRWSHLVDGLTYDYKYNMESYDWDNAPDLGEIEEEQILGDDEVTEEREEISWVKILQDAKMAFGNDCWAGCEPGWCGDWEEENCGNYMAWSWFKYYEYTEAGDGDNGSCFKLKFSENFDDSSIIDYDTTDDYYEPSMLSIYGDVAIKDGKLVSFFADDSLSIINDGPRIATGCKASDRNSDIMEDSEDKVGEIPENENLRGAGDHPPELATFKEMYQAKMTGSNILKTRNNKIEYHIQQASDVNLSMYSLDGKLVKTLVKENQKAGAYNLILNKSNLASGSYSLVLQTPNGRNVTRIISVSETR